MCTHEWEEDYYGVRCKICRAFIPYGCEPWAYTDDSFSEQEELYLYHTCETCGGEFWDGGTSCTCDYPIPTGDERMYIA